jgi:WD40 repeat protein
MSRRAVLAAGILVALAAPAPGAAPKVPAELAADPPVLRLEAGGPTAPMYALAFGPDGRTLYAAGFDKVVRTWGLGADGRWSLRDTAYRVPIGPDTAGVINALAVSPDNRWLAVGGVGVVEGESRYAESGQIFRIRPRQVETDRGAIFLFPIGSPADQPAVRRLVGHKGPVVALAFAPAAAGGDPILISAAREPGAADATSSGRVIAWDLNLPGRKEQVGEYPVGEIDPAQKPPALAVRRGQGAKDVRVAVAWDDGHVRLWDVADKESQTFPDGARLGNSTAVFTSLGDLATCGFGQGKGYLHSWRDGPGGKLQTNDLKPFPVDDAKFVTALGLAGVRPRNGGEGHLAVLLRVESKDARVFYRLGLVALGSRKLVAAAPLWPGATSRPVLAVSPDGRYVAAAGADQPTVRVYAVDELLAGRQDPHQPPLQSVGVSVRRLAFVEREGARLPGLLLGLSPPRAPLDPVTPAKDDLVFDFVNRDLTRDPAQQGWKVAGAAEDGWKVTGVAPRKAGEPWLIDWQRRGGTRERSAVRLDVAEDLTAVAVVPPIKDVTESPLLAAAAWHREKSQPLLALYDTRAGGPETPLVQVRQLRGHVQPVRSLAVTRDGRLLASAADDQTVSLWSLTDLKEILGRHGALPDVDLVDHGRDVVVEKVDPGSPTDDSKALLKEDVIRGVAFKENAEKPPAPTSGLALSEELWKVKPGQPIWLTVRREENGKAKDVTVALKTGQAVDDRKPLLSLFLARPGGAEWIAWTPGGPYDARGKKIEDYVGWHFNPKRPGEPATFAPMNVYRGNFYEEHLLEPLVTHASLRGALEEINRPPAPRVRINAPRPPAEQGGPLFVRDPVVPLAVTVEGPSIEKEQVGGVTVTVDGREEKLDLAAADGQRLGKRVQLEGRGDHTVKVRAVTADGQSDEQELHLFYQPPAPVLTLQGLPLKDPVGEKRYTLRAEVKPGRAGQEAIPRLYQLAGGKATPLQLAPGEITKVPGVDVLRIEKELTLKPNENAFRLEAANAGALAGHEAEETAAETFVVTFQKQETPRVAFTEVELDPGTKRARRLPVEPGKTRFVDSPAVRLLGRAAGEAGLAQVTLQADGTAMRLPKPEGRRFDLDHTLAEPLQPGREYTFVLAAKTPRSDEGEAAVVLQYQPLLPGLELVTPLDGQEFHEGPDRAGAPEVEVKGVLTLPDDFHPFKVVLQVLNDNVAVPQKDGVREEVVFADRAKAGGGEPVTLGTVRTRRGINRIQVQVRNDWREDPPLERTVKFLRPPFVLNGKAVLEGKKLHVRAEITAPAEAPLDHVVLNDRPYPPRDIAGEPATDKRQVTTWPVDKVIEYPQGKKTIALRADGADGQAEVTLEVPRLPLPDDLVLDVEGPKGDKVREPSCTLHFKVQSLTKLKRLRVLRNGQVVANVDVNGQHQDPRGTTWDFEDDVPVNGLRPNVNQLRVEAVNQDSEKSVERAVTYAVPPLALQLDKPDAGKPVPAEYTLVGKVLWQDEGQAGQVEEKLKRLRVDVNGFRQRPPVQIKRGEHEHAFSVKMLLNAPQNTVHVECPGLPLKEAEFDVECARPEKPGRLHLLIVNAGKNDITEEELVRRAFVALQVQPGGAELHSDVFRKVVPYPAPTAQQKIRPLVGYHAHKQTIEALLGDIKEAVRKEGSPSDVVLVYWLGEEAADDKGEWYLKTSDTASHPKAKLSETGVRLRDLLMIDEDVAVGARVVLLDVVSGQRPGGPPPFDLARSDAAVLRYAWSLKEVPLSGLLLALESAGKKTPEVTLEKLAESARANPATARVGPPELHENLAGKGRIPLAGKSSAQAP